MRGSIARALYLFALFVCAAGPAAADIIINGSFEEPPHTGPYHYVPGGSNAIASWETIFTGVERFDPNIYGAGSAQDGLFCIDLNTDTFTAAGGIQQTVATAPGGTYVLSFYGGTWLDRGRIGVANIEVFIDGTAYPFKVVNPTSTIVWTPLTLSFTAMTGSTTIAFRNFDPPDETFSLIDSVSLEGPPPPPPIPVDHDLDGVADVVDQCPDSDPSATIVIDGCDTGVPNPVSEDGCKGSDAFAECAASARNHGDFVSCVAYVTNQMKKSGAITGEQKGAIMSCAAQANIP